MKKSDTICGSPEESNIMICSFYKYGILNIERVVKYIKEIIKVLKGIIVTNYYTDKDVKKKAKEKNIIILDRSEFEDGIYN